MVQYITQKQFVEVLNEKKVNAFFFFFASHEHLHELISILTVLANFVSGFSGQQFFFNTARV